MWLYLFRGGPTDHAYDGVSRAPFSRNWACWWLNTRWPGPMSYVPRRQNTWGCGSDPRAGGDRIVAITPSIVPAFPAVRCAHVLCLLMLLSLWLSSPWKSVVPNPVCCRTSRVQINVVFWCSSIDVECMGPALSGEVPRLHLVSRNHDVAGSVSIPRPAPGLYSLAQTL